MDFALSFLSAWISSLDRMDGRKYRKVDKVESINHFAIAHGKVLRIEDEEHLAQYALLKLDKKAIIKGRQWIDDIHSTFKIQRQAFHQKIEQRD